MQNLAHSRNLRYIQAMPSIVTIAERKRARTEDVRRAFAELRPLLDAYARDRGVSFWIYGSAARGELRYDSDIDIIVDPGDGPDAEWRATEAISFIEDECERLGLKADVQPKTWCKPLFLDTIRPGAVIFAREQARKQA